MKLDQLLKAITVLEFSGDPDLEIHGLAYDSRRIKPGDLFVALKGHNLNGHDYLKDAIERGSKALLAEEFQGAQNNVSKILVSDSRDALSKLAIRFYDEPFKGMRLVGITGTNGKTTTCYILESILSAAGKHPGVIGTINYRFSGKSHPAPVTTPESLDLMGLFREMADGGVTDVIMEASSHALDQGRTSGCPFKVAVFTNISRDHLDYHRDMEAYFQAKSLLFKGLCRTKSVNPCHAVINLDDPRGHEIMALTDANIMSYGLGGKCAVRANSLRADKEGIRARLITPVGESTFHSPLIGEVNIYNILAAAAASLCLETGIDAVVEGIERMKAVPGRMEFVPNRRGLMVIVDYAHTPDALMKTVRNLKPFVKGHFITVFGCGGDRDKGKRSEMGSVAARGSDLVIITSDNPRSEDPWDIIRQIEEGVQRSGLNKLAWSTDKPCHRKGYYLEVDRRKAIRRAIALAQKEDLVLIAGKGHEDYQIVGAEKKYFDDRKEAARAVFLESSDDIEMPVRGPIDGR